MESKKTVIIDIQYLQIAKTGLRTYIYQLIQALEVSEKYDFILKPSLEKIENGNSFNLSIPGLRLFQHLHILIWKQIVIPYIVYKHRAYAVIFPDFHAPIWKLKCKKIVIFHDAFFWESPEDYNTKWLKYFRWSILKGLRGNSRIVAVSKTTKNKIIPLIEDCNVVDVVYQSAPDLSVDHSKIAIENIKSNMYFLHVGVMEKRKNLTTLVKGFAMLIKEYPTFQLVLAGQPGPRPDLNDYASITKCVLDEKLEDSVVMTGHVSTDELYWLFHNAFVYTFPSKNEGFGIPVLEAFSNNIPLIISSNPALREIAGDAALVVKETTSAKDWYVAMKKLIDSPEIASKLQAKGKLQLQKFTKAAFKVGIEKVLSK